MAYLLMIDDNPQNQRYLERIIRHRTSHELAFAGSGQEGIEKMVERLPDLIFLDLFIPGMDGLELFHLLRQHPVTKDIPIVIHTAVPFDQFTRLRLRRVQADGFVEFPIEASELIHLVDAALQRRSRAVRRWIPPRTSDSDHPSSNS